MDWGNIILLGLAGLTGLLLGMIVSAIIGPVLSFIGDGFRQVVSWLLILGATVAAVIYLPAYIGPYVTPYIDQLVDDEEVEIVDNRVVEKEPATEEKVAEAIEQALADLQDPFFEAVLRKEPSRANSVKVRLVSAYQRGGQQELVDELQKADQEIIASAFPYYMARAQEADLIAAVRQISATIRLLSENDPVTCHLWLYGSLTGNTFDFDRYIAAVGEDGHLALQQRLAVVVEGADSILPEYDEARAEQTLAEIGDQLMMEVGVEKIGLITSGQIPESEADAKLACDATADFHDLILAEDNAADILRHRYVTATF